MSRWTRDTDETKLEIADIIGSQGPDVDLVAELRRRRDTRTGEAA